MSLAGGDLTTLASAKVYLDSPPSDPVLTPLITRISRLILAYLNRPLLVPQTYTDQYNGSGTTSLVLPHWPLLAALPASPLTITVSGLALNLAPQANGQSATATPYGYRVQPWNGLPPGNPPVIELTGGAWFIPGNQNVVVVYKAGYAIVGEIPSGTPYAPLAPYGIWATDEGVTYSDGTALTPTSGSSPGVSEYVPPAPEAPAPTTQYIFNPADVATGLSLSYGFVPAEVEQVCIELIAERASYRKRVGIRSQSLGGQETMAYDLSGLPAYAKAMLQPYVSVLPPAMGASV
jgi:hypothetical protein